MMKAINKDNSESSESDIQAAQMKLNVRKIKAGKDASNILLPVTICGVELEIDPDTSADVDLLSKDDFKIIYNECPEVADFITIPKEATCALGGAELGIICVLKGATFSNKTVKSLTKDVYVIENETHTHPLLSEKTLLNLGMIRYSADGAFAEKRVLKTEWMDGTTDVESNQPKEALHDKKGTAAMEKILSTHKKLFKGIGKFKDPYSQEPILTHFQMKPEIESVIQPPRVIPHHLRDRTKEKLEYFMQEGVVSWTEPGEPITYASPLVITSKSSDPNADVRITADF
jgi:hypothetical protein